MKVTITEKGLEYRKKAFLETLPDQYNGEPKGHFSTFSPSKYSKTLQKSQSQKPSTAGSSLFTINKATADSVFDSLLPIMLSKSPPTEVNVKKAQVIVSQEFRRKFPHTPLFGSTPNHSMLKKLYGTINPHIHNKGWNTENGFAKASQGKLPSCTFRPETAQPSDPVRVFLKSLKSSFIMKKHEEINKTRTELDKRIKYAILRNRKLEEQQLNDYTKEIGNAKEIENTPLSPQKDQKRYKERIFQKHRETVKIWEYKQRTLDLAKNKRRNVKYSVLKNPALSFNNHYT